MARIRSRDTKPELLVRKYLHRAGFRYRLHASGLPGRPDIVLPKYGVAIFVQGCFWHGHVCQGGRVPRTNSKFWLEKVSTNQARDRRNERKLRAAGWRVFSVWECQLRTAENREKVLTRLASKIHSALDS
jgi:DNA mismatch endonuclease (patch repair protein)